MNCITYCLLVVLKKIKKEHFLLDYLILIVYKTFRKDDGSLAQLEEHLVYTERVGSSNLSTPTNKRTAVKAVFLVKGVTAGAPAERNLTKAKVC